MELLVLKSANSDATTLTVDGDELVVFDGSEAVGFCLTPQTRNQLIAELLLTANGGVSVSLEALLAASAGNAYREAAAMITTLNDFGDDQELEMAPQKLDELAATLVTRADALAANRFEEAVDAAVARSTVAAVDKYCPTCLGTTRVYLDGQQMTCTTCREHPGLRS